MRPVTLQEITTSIFDGKHGDCVDLPGSGLYFISVKDLKEYDIDYSNAREITPEDFAQNYLRTSLENGDTIYANTGDTIGKSLFVERNNLADKTSFQKSVAVLKPNAEMVEPRYLYYLLKYETPRLRQAATGSGQKNLLLSTMRDFETRIHDRETQSNIVAVLGCIDQKIHTNLSINDNLWQTISTIYDYWFSQFDFPDVNRKPYYTAGGKMVWNDKIKRAIPSGWTVASIINNPLTQVIKPGVDAFTTKEYLATAEVTGTSIASGSIVDYENREGRANMQPVVNSVWFAKMKNSIKHLFLNKEMAPIIDSTILSTGFCGLQCSEKSFEYVASFVSNPRFEIIKDILAHGATQEAVNNDDMESIAFVIPSDEILEQYHTATKGMFAQISKNICENRELIKVRDWLLPMLMNGQATIAD
jgi:type I restriction enzyme S subunit